MTHSALPPLFKLLMKNSTLAPLGSYRLSIDRHDFLASLSAN